MDDLFLIARDVHRVGQFQLVEGLDAGGVLERLAGDKVTSEPRGDLQVPFLALGDFDFRPFDGLLRAAGRRGTRSEDVLADRHVELEISSAEAVTGCEKQVTYKRGKGTKKLMVQIPPGVKPGTKIRLKGMGMMEDKKSGDLYLDIKVKD